MQIEIPTNCPSCNSSLVFVKDVLYCKNPECGSVSRKKVEHFASTLKIKGLGPSTIDKLDLTSPIEIYSLTEEQASKLLGSDRIAEKLMMEIETSKSRVLNDVLPALGIPLIGATATAKLAKVCTDIYSIDEDSCKEAGLGPKATDNLLTWLNDHSWYLTLPQELVFAKNSTTSVKGIVCITGKLTSFSTKAQAEKELINAGYIVKSSITKDVTILINESGKETTKTQKARESGIQVLDNLKILLNGE